MKYEVINITSEYDGIHYFAFIRAYKSTCLDRVFNKREGYMRAWGQYGTDIWFRVPHLDPIKENNPTHYEDFTRIKRKLAITINNHVMRYRFKQIHRDIDHNYITEKEKAFIKAQKNY